MGCRMEEQRVRQIVRDNPGLQVFQIAEILVPFPKFANERLQAMSAVYAFLEGRLEAMWTVDG